MNLVAASALSVRVGLGSAEAAMAELERFEGGRQGVTFTGARAVLL